MSDTAFTDFQWADPFLLEQQLTDEERMARDSVRGYCGDHLMPRITEAHRKLRRAHEPHAARRALLHQGSGEMVRFRRGYPADLDISIEPYNLKRSHQGYWLNGRTPAQALREALCRKKLPPIIPKEDETAVTEAAYSELSDPPSVG